MECVLVWNSSNRHELKLKPFNCSLLFKKSCEAQIGCQFSTVFTNFDMKSPFSWNRNIALKFNFQDYRSRMSDETELLCRHIWLTKYLESSPLGTNTLVISDKVNAYCKEYNYEVAYQRCFCNHAKSCYVDQEIERKYLMTDNTNSWLQIHIKEHLKVLQLKKSLNIIRNTIVKNECQISISYLIMENLLSQTGWKYQIFHK